jgi:hypothetical protein
MATFRGFEPHDFDAYAPQKWRSNVYNLERMQVKEKLLALARELSPVQADPQSPPLAVEASADHPALWNGNEVRVQSVYFLRAEAERQELFSRITRAKSMQSLLADPNPYREHIHLSVTLSQDCLCVALQIYPDATVDRENVARMIADGWRLQTLVERVNELPSAFGVQLGPAEPADPAAVGSEALRDAFTAEPKPPAPGTTAAPVLAASRRYPREEERLFSPELPARLREDLDELLPLYRALSWSRDNDFLSVKESIREEKKAKRSRGVGKDDRVRVTRGLFTGKTGTVLATDAKGGLKVRLGTMVVKLDANDVVVVR